MGFLEENGNLEIYKNLTKPDSSKVNQKWTYYLALCCVTVCLGSFQFGYNIVSLNLVEPKVVDFFDKVYWGDMLWAKLPILREGIDKLNNGIEKYNNGSISLEEGKKLMRDAENKQLKYMEIQFTGNLTAKEDAQKTKLEKEMKIREEYNMTIQEFMDFSREKLQNGTKAMTIGRELISDSLKKKEQGTIDLYKGIKMISNFNYIIWGFINSLFVFGGLIGALTSKYVMDRFGRKNSIIFHLFFSIAGSIAVFFAYHFASPQACVNIFEADFAQVPASSKLGPILLKLGRFLQGIQGGLSCCLIPTYLSEIAPSKLRGQTGVIHNLFLTLGMLCAQFLGFENLLGKCDSWSYLLAVPLLPAVVSVLGLLVFCEETPKYLFFEKQDEIGAIKVLMKLRDMNDVSAEMQKIYEEKRDMNDQTEVMTVSQVLKAKELRWPLISGIVLQIAQQMCGINAVFFYSRAIFEKAGVQSNYIEYLVLLTGIINVLCTLACGMLVDKVGRKPLLIITLSFMAVDLFLLTIFIRLNHITEFSYLAVFCIVIFIVCFAIGLGPIPYIFVAESFTQNSRSSAMSICTFNNWFWNLILILLFPILLKLLSGYVFVVFNAIVIATVIFVAFSIPETKDKTPEEIQFYYNGIKSFELKEDLVV